MPAERPGEFHEGDAGGSPVGAQTRSWGPEAYLEKRPAGTWGKAPRSVDRRRRTGVLRTPGGAPCLNGAWVSPLFIAHRSRLDTVVVSCLGGTSKEKRRTGSEGGGRQGAGRPTRCQGSRRLRRYRLTVGP